MEPNQTTDQNNDQNSAKQQIIDRLKEASNVLVTVSNNPSVDQLAACIGLTLLLNRLGKHGTAVFSGAVPHTVEFLQPEKTLEKNTDSLRDFIIALDKSKADKLRYKVEETTVKIFITPYRTSLSNEDLDFSHGDFNVDVVVALGVHEQGELDAAITAQGRILHDATIISINNKSESSLGTLNWHDDSTSSLCEMLVGVGEALKKDFLDTQMATAFLTGIVAETERFSNEKTTPQTMAAAGKLMAAGANQQLISSELEEPEPEPEPIPEAEPESAPDNADASNSSDSDEPPDELPPPIDGSDNPNPPPPNDDGTLQITHEGHPRLEDPEENLTYGADPPPEAPRDQIHIDEHGTLRHADEITAEALPDQPLPPADPLLEASKLGGGRHILTAPTPNAANAAPAPDGALAAPGPDSFLPSSSNDAEALDLPPVEASHVPLLNRDTPAEPPETLPEPPAESESQPVAVPTLDQLENDLRSPHAQAPEPLSPPSDAPIAAPPDLDAARDAVADVVETTPTQPPLEPIAALNAMPGLEIDHNSPPPDMPPVADPPPTTDRQPPEPPSPPPSDSATPPPPPVPPPWQPSTASDDDQTNTMPSSSNPFTLPPAA